jgi:hypothetical protein
MALDDGSLRILVDLEDVRSSPPPPIAHTATQKPATPSIPGIDDAATTTEQPAPDASGTPSAAALLRRRTNTPTFVSPSSGARICSCKYEVRALAPLSPFALVLDFCWERPQAVNNAISPGVSGGGGTGRRRLRRRHWEAAASAAALGGGGDGGDVQDGQPGPLTV